ncbi:MAG: 3-isopropylmalate dehydratase small subunit [Candidatus Marinimicrobia bacterium]|nr:3-isopropylmalate dehydratase small subunit [Candidatus Neomarinimicrobiota bacterium]
MQNFQTFTGIVVPMNRDNIDTDAIIPKQFLKSIKRTGFGPNLFDEWRYLDYGEPDQDCSSRPLNKDFVLNQRRYKDATILLTRENFGCGSSREHAPWALADYGIKTIIAESFADIFYNNCFKNGILPITLGKNIVKALFQKTETEKEFFITVNLEEQLLTDSAGDYLDFELEGFRKDILLKGLDEIGLTLTHKKEIQDFESQYKKEQPWLFTIL